MEVEAELNTVLQWVKLPPELPDSQTHAAWSLSCSTSCTSPANAPGKAVETAYVFGLFTHVGYLEQAPTCWL